MQKVFLHFASIFASWLRQMPLFNFYCRNRPAFEKLRSIPSCLPPEGFFKLFVHVPSLPPTNASTADSKGGLKALLTTAQCEAFLFAGGSCWDLSLANCFVTVTNSGTAEAICNSMRDSRSHIWYRGGHAAVIGSSNMNPSCHFLVVYNDMLAFYTWYYVLAAVFVHATSM